jgi:hypothetical protein
MLPSLIHCIIMTARWPASPVRLKTYPAHFTASHASLTAYRARLTSSLARLTASPTRFIASPAHFSILFDSFRMPKIYPVLFNLQKREKNERKNDSPVSKIRGVADF